MSAGGTRSISRLARVVAWLAGVLLFVFMVGSVTLNLGYIFRVNELNSERQQITEEYTALYAQYLAEVGSRPDTQTPTQVQATTPGPTGAQGPRGEAGDSMTSQEVLELFRLYCADGRCVGADGAQGLPGQNGVNGVNGLDGAQGPAGAPGANGTDGRSVTAIVCEANSYAVFYDQYGVEIGRVGMMCF